MTRSLATIMRVREEALYDLAEAIALGNRRPQDYDLYDTCQSKRRAAARLANLYTKQEKNT